ncbi:MAG: hypothetical protein BZY88_02825 [SAR202 cluster bacterium Io17-Chloro-G9]|nr:MAG: hypothetical protein BZY88_02825 [SAR202 cluster bacterium Io17-Chloro-G9]
MPLQPSNTDITVVQTCGVCNFEIDSYTVKLDNLMLVSKEQIWCPKCQASRPEVRVVAGRRDAVTKEQASYPKSVPAASNFPPQSRQSG